MRLTGSNQAPLATKTWDGGTSGTGTALDTAANWNGDTLPTTTDEVLFDNSILATLPSQLTTTGASLTFGDLLWNSNNSSTITINTSSNINSRTITLSGGGGSTAAIAAGGASGDLLLMGTAATTNTLTFSGNVGTGNSKLSLALGTSGNFDVVNSGATLNIGVSINGVGQSVTKTGNGLLIYSGSTLNGYDGTTTVNSGELDLNKTGVAVNNAILGNLTIGDGNGTDTVKLLASDQIRDTSDVTINSSGVLNLNSNSETIDALISNSATASVALGSGMLTIGAGSQPTATFAGVISGAGNLDKTGSGTQILSGANTYSGKTRILSGALSVSSLNSVVGGTASSSLGAPTTVANGTINIGNGSQSGTLIYTGTGETTDRVINLSGAGSPAGGAIIDQSGTGLLKFTSDFTDTGLNAKTLTLQGSTAGSGEISGAIPDGSLGATSVTKSGSGTWTLSGASANTYTGTTTVNGGELDLNKTAGVNAIAGNLTIGDGTGTDTVKLLADNQIANTSDVTVNSSGVFNLNSKPETIDAINGVAGASVTLGSGILTVGANNDGSASFAGVISGTGGLTKTGNGTQTLSGASTYSGGSTLNAGTLQLGSSSTGNVTNGPVGTGTLILNNGTLASDSTSARSIANAITFGGDVTFGTNTNFGDLALSGAGTLTGNRTLTFIADVTYSGNIGESGGSFGITKNGSGTLKLSGFNTYSGGTTVNDGLLWLNSTGALGSSSGSLTVNGGIVDLGGNSVTVGNLNGSGGTIRNNLNAQNTTATLTIGSGDAGGGNYQGTITDNTGASNGILALTKTGTGTITLSGANTYTGATTINGGTLLINGSTASGSAVTVNNTGTLGGTGTVGGTVTVNSGGTIRGGSGAVASGSLTVSNTLTLNSNSVIQLALGPSGTHSTLALGGSVSFQVTQQFNFIDLGAQTTSYSGIITGVTTPVVTGGWTIDNTGWSGVFTYNIGTQSIDLTLTAIPEPGTWFGAALALSILLYTQRRRMRACSRARCSRDR